MRDFPFALGNRPFPECRLLSRHINIQETDTEFLGHLTNMRPCAIGFLGAADTLKDSHLGRAKRLIGARQCSKPQR
jgi:hypothetical protein